MSPIHSTHIYRFLVLFFVMSTTTICVANAAIQHHSQINSDFTPKQRQHVIALYRAIETADVDTIAKHVEYPYHVAPELAPINNAAEFKREIKQIFDKRVAAQLLSAMLDQWKATNSGYVLDHGLMKLSHDIKIQKINYITDYQHQLREKARRSLHPSIQDYSKHLFTFDTKSYDIRIDEVIKPASSLSKSSKKPTKNTRKPELAADVLSFRYSAWKRNHDTHQKPDIVLNNGVITFDGTGGNHHYTFKRGKYTYVVRVNVLTPSNFPKYHLTVYKNDTQILKQASLARW